MRTALTLALLCALGPPAASANTQTFSGEFVQQVAAAWPTQEARNCLRNQGASNIEILTLASGEISTAPAVCAIVPRPAQVTKTPTNRTSLSANELLALIVVRDRFASEMRFATNDRTIAHYTFEINERPGVLVILIDPPPSNRDIAGCPKTGPIGTAYIVDLHSFQVRLGNMVC